MNFKERIINGLYAQAVCDAVGNHFEFKENIDPDDVIAYANTTDKLVISDDTQMALFGFEAIQFHKDYSGDIFEAIEDVFTHSYLNWYHTQTSIPENRSFRNDTQLLSFRSMWSVQAPGNTCLFALKTLKNGGVVENDSKGCGSVMRLLPIVLMRNSYSPEDCVKIAQISAAITHKHHENATTAEHYMNLVESIGNGLTHYSEFDHLNHISEIGEGWTAQECLDMAEWAYCKADTFDDLLRLSISHDGDSDSVAAVAGSLWGLSGREVPQKYIDKLDALDAIEWTIKNI